MALAQITLLIICRVGYILRCIMNSSSAVSRLIHLAAAFSVPWNAFVAAFLYYSLLAVLALGGSNPGAGMVAGAYAVPPVMYVATMMLRVTRAVSAWVKAARPHGITTAHSAA
jgi:hypothetical protein